jgi:uncharacterized membrane protein/thiol-disulfide isomerase/thioredoxin
LNKKKQQTVTELWKLTHYWLRVLGHKPNAKYCREEITTHPDYPAMTAVTDFLDAGNMQYNAVQADASYIHEFNYPLLAHIRQPGQQYLHIISNATEWDKQKEITQHWSGIVLFPEKNVVWQNEQNSIYEKEDFKNKIFATVLIGVAFGLLIASSINQIYIAVIAFGLLSLLGLIISIVLLGTELGYQSQIIKQVCGAVSNGGCEKVLKSKYAKGVFGITPADASVLYFGTQFICYLLSTYFNNLFNCLLLIALVGIIIAGWSIYTQAVKLKQWCALCIGIVAVLILQIALVLIITNALPVTIGHQFLNLISLKAFLIFLLIFTILTIALFPIKQLIKTNNSNKQKLTELKKWKTDANLFTTLWQQEQQVDTSIWDNDLVIGNLDAPILITIACNPYCSPCAKAHKELDDLLHCFPNKVKIQIRLLCYAENEADNRTIAVNAILQKAATCQSNIELQQMLTDWFEWMNLEKWISKWGRKNQVNRSFNQSSTFIFSNNEIEMSARDALSQHSKWIKESNIVATPTFFVNGKKLSGRYNLKDIQTLLPELVEILTKEVVK